MRYVIKVAYDGTDFSGWQVQKNARTVQEELTLAAKRAFGGDVTIVASGRTDAGVHALGQVCHADISANVSGEKLADALNRFLPPDVAVLASAVAPEGFDANRSAKRKTYQYRMYFSSRRNPLLDRYAVRVKGGCDLAAMKGAAAEFIGEHDFRAYCASGSSAKTTVRTIFSFDVEERDGCVVLSVCGNGFLYNMVRTLAGTVLFYSMGKLNDSDIARTLEEGDRNGTGKTMPPQGLTLKSVDYGFELFK